ncbi:MAG: carboxylesterase [Oleispira antarctica]|uniref:Carboxylesterase n=1 Tax=Oleispira antarctica RB-8 TaxID=698738 RepID=R4YSK2_OLEAN|nr:carboxylesterase [Oleispira antarctica]MBQ0791000.1 carboxylesterase [Oleispira antarctica]CCK75109.1 Carboxylesterase [Oleispira antarctica RB-8]
MPYLPAIEIEPANTDLNNSQATSIIWLHGLGASGDDFAALVPELKTLLGASVNNIRFIFPHASEIPVTINGGISMPAWYDILDMPTQVKVGESAERKINQSQLLASAKDIQNLIDREIERGVNSERILVLGFSQGGAVAYHAALTYPHSLGGLAGLSTYFPILSAPNTFVPSPNNQNIDIQIYHGNIDPVVNQSLGLKAQSDLTTLGYQIQYHDYPMEHQVCYEQVKDIADWIQAKLD